MQNTAGPVEAFGGLPDAQVRGCILLVLGSRRPVLNQRIDGRGKP